MENAGSVRRVECARELDTEADDLLGWHRAIQRCAVYIFKHQVVGADVVDLADVRMVKRRNRMRFLGAALDMLGTQSFEGDGPRKSRVARLMFENGRAAGVELDGGEIIYAPVVVSSLDPQTTLLKLGGPRHLPFGLKRRLKGLHVEGVTAKVNLALTGLPTFKGLQRDDLRARLLVCPSIDYLERAFIIARQGNFSSEPAMEIIREGDGGDFMLMVVEGKVEVLKRDRWNTPQLLATVDAGRTLGEMSMIDGEARFATCIAVAPVLIAVLDREALARIIVEQPLLGAKILMELVLMLSQRLRATSQKLLGLLDEQAQSAPSI